MPDWNTLICKMAESIKYSRCSTCKKKTKDCKKTCKFSDTFSADEFLKISQYVYNKNKTTYRRILADNINHTKVDLSNYMWGNIARHSQCMELLVMHKDQIIPNIQKRIKLDQATEFERKVLYGYFLEKPKL